MSFFRTTINIEQDVISNPEVTSKVGMENQYDPTSCTNVLIFNDFISVLVLYCPRLSRSSCASRCPEKIIRISIDLSKFINLTLNHDIIQIYPRFLIFLNKLTAINESSKVEKASWPKRQLAPACKDILLCDILSCLHTCHNNMDSKNGQLVYQVTLIVFFEKLLNIVLTY